VKTRFLVLRPEEPNEGLTVELPRRPTYEQIAAVVRPVLQCEWFEHVSVLADFKGGLAFGRADMFVDEMGHPKNLPRNGNATAIYRRNALLHQGVKDPETLDWIAGPALLCERVIWT
jgi:hypothetical protein